jgi:hypothetical protein
MSVTKSYDLLNGQQLPYQGIADKLTGDPFRQAFEAKRSKAGAGQLIRKKNKRDIEKEKLQEPQKVESIVEAFSGREQMMRYIDRSEERSRSFSSHAHARSCSYDLSKSVLQTPHSVRPLIQDDDTRQRERSRKMSDMAAYLRQ